MSEIIAIDYCPKCGKHTEFMFSGSGTKGTCQVCDYALPPEQHCDSTKVIFCDEMYEDKWEEKDKEDEKDD